MVLSTLSACKNQRTTELSGDIALAAIDGSVHHPLRSSGKATAFIFITNDCPIANGYAPEINRIVNEYTARGVSIYLVHVDRDILAEQAKTHASEYGYTCPVLLDTKHLLVHATGATVTPEAAVIDQNRALAYRGRIDDRYTDFGKRRAEPSKRDLREALDAVLAGRSVLEARTRAIGCYIAD